MKQEKGFSFPLAVDPTTGRFKTTASLEEDIRESIYVIMMTNPGERVLNEDFGCGVNKYVFGEVNMDMITRIRQEVYNNIVAWEPRATDVSVSLNEAASDINKIVINIAYAIAGENRADEFSVSLDLMEGV
ncbi:MAG: GPW/gp25 family protein [Firmicutes bacterium]|nr:GPW/gp25 family protein [Bacillota bacterium]